MYFREHGSIEAHAFMDVKRIKGISAAGWWDRNGSDPPLLLLGHSDGSLQIYNVKTDAGRHSSQLMFSYVSENKMGALLVTTVLTLMFLAFRRKRFCGDGVE